MVQKKRLIGEEARTEAFAKVDQQRINEIFGITFDEELLKLALTHRSFANENGGLTNNERLEFLGDAVLDLVVAEELYLRYPRVTEQQISRLRAAVVNMYALAELARELQLGQYVFLGHGEIINGGNNKHSILADTVEALLGAMYLQYGFEQSKETILRLFDSTISNASSEPRTKDWKTALAERAALLKITDLVYQVAKEGPEHDLTFYITLSVEGQVLGQGVGKTKKAAEMFAAQQAFEALATRV